MLQEPPTLVMSQKKRLLIKRLGACVYVVSASLFMTPDSNAFDCRLYAGLLRIVKLPEKVD